MVEKKNIEGCDVPLETKEVRKVQRSEDPWDRLKLYIIDAFQNHDELQLVCQELANKFATDVNYTHWCMIIKKADYEFDKALMQA